LGKGLGAPKGWVSRGIPHEERAAGEMTQSADIDSHTRTNALKVHHAAMDANNNFIRKDERINLADEPDHQELCNREQRFFLKAIQEGIDLTDQMNDAVNSLRIVLAADESIRTRRVVNLTPARAARAGAPPSAKRRAGVPRTAARPAAERPRQRPP